MWPLFNNLLVTAILLALAVVVTVPRLSARYLAFQDRRVLAVGTFVFAVESLCVNVARLWGIECQNAQGEFFGDFRLEEVLRRNQGQSPSACSDALLAEIGRWRPAAVPQQDDITLVIADVE